MTTLAITEALIPSIETLADILVQTSESYQQLLKQPESHAYCLEAGRSVRYLSVGGQALPDNQAEPDLQNALLLGY
ncbi:MAG: hypothetical protein Q8N96_11470 [Methylovulum sp.]|nr:hypothetical protein [Methylovulum sp.]